MLILIFPVFKIFSLDENGLAEKANLRAGKHLNLNFSCNDVVWNPVEGRPNVLIITFSISYRVIWHCKTMKILYFYRSRLKVNK